MTKYLSRRVLSSLITIIFSFMLTFFLIRYAPGNPIKLLSGKDNPNPEQIEYLTKKYGLDKPITTQFYMYLKNAMKGDFGVSYKSNEPVMDLIKIKFKPTITLTLTAALFSLLIGTLLGLYAGKNIDSKMDRFLCKLSYIIDAIPVFWLAMILVLLFGVKWKLFPTSGVRDLRYDYTGWKAFLDRARHMFLPVLTIVIVQAPVYFRITRASVLETLNENFIRTFRAAGVDENKIFRKYVLRNSIIPVVTSFTLSLAFIISGAALIEIVFAWPGMGRLILDSVSGRDYQVLTAIYLILSISISLFSILTDILYALIDPRIRLK